MKYLITGGTGSLGKALIHRLKQEEAQIIVYSRDEGKQALSFGQDPDVHCIIGDVRDYQKFNVTVKRLKPDYIIHTAALKRIDDMEIHPDECVKTNIAGSENVARAALENKVKKCILVSTDKACQPVNVYGSSKFIAERIFTNYDYFSKDTIFASVRYGNVIASRGSFLPLWIGLVNEGKSIKVTSTEMTRFLFTLSDAVDTVIGALRNAEGGEVFVPQINSFTIMTVVEAVQKICKVEKVNYDIIGLRPGEKLHEDMLATTELPYTYSVDNINLLCVRPQYTHRAHNIIWEKYTGPEFNSELHVSDNTQDLVQLISRGLKETI